MVVNQLFIKKPSHELLNKIIIAFGLTSINDSKEFSQLDMDKHKTIQNINNFKNDIINCYIPCKRKTYEENCNRNLGNITMFRQILKTHNHDLYSKEKFIKGVKYLVYKIVTKQEKILKNKTKKKKEKLKDIVIVFD